MLTSDDPTFVIADAMYWSVIETNIGILAASIPSYKALAKKYAPRLLGSSGSGSRKLSGFKMVSRSLGHTAGTQSQSVSATATRSDKPGFNPDVKNNIPSDNSSEEALFTPSGRIGVKTEIVHQFEEAQTAPREREMSLPIQGPSKRSSLNGFK